MVLFFNYPFDFRLVSVDSTLVIQIVNLGLHYLIKAICCLVIGICKAEQRLLLWLKVLMQVKHLDAHDICKYVLIIFVFAFLLMIHVVSPVVHGVANCRVRCFVCK